MPRPTTRAARRGFCASLLSTLLALAASFPAFAAAPQSAADWEAMSRRVDERLRERAEAEGIAAAPAASDTVFLRRLSLDLIGRIPHVAEVRDWLADNRPDRREQLVERLLDSPGFASHMAATLRRMFLPQPADPRRVGYAYQLEGWLHRRIAEGEPYDALVREILLEDGSLPGTPSASYYAALDNQPETVAANVSRGLLGIQIQCAECHDHPFDHWKRRDFWGLAAFFARLEPPGRPGGAGVVPREAKQGELTLPGTDEIIPPRFLGSDQPPDPSGSRRRQLTDWITAADNPYFAKAAVNRLWAQLFGHGLVEPVDDLGQHNPGLHPELLDELSDYFVQSGFDLRNLVRVLVNTQAYQLSSQAAAGDVSPQFFRHMTIKSLSADQLYDCLATALANPTSSNGAAAYQSRYFSPARREFLNRFDSAAQERTEYRSGIPQALTLMNGTLIRQGTDLEQGPLLQALRAPFFDDAQRIEILFLATLSREPRPEESERFLAYVHRHESAEQRRAALADILWALLNSAEFTLNH